MISQYQHNVIYIKHVIDISCLVVECILPWVIVTDDLIGHIMPSKKMNCSTLSRLLTWHCPQEASSNVFVLVLFFSFFLFLYLFAHSVFYLFVINIQVVGGEWQMVGHQHQTSCHGAASYLIHRAVIPTRNLRALLLAVFLVCQVMLLCALFLASF